MIVMRNETKSRKPFTAVLGIHNSRANSWPDETKAERASWPVADKRLTINEKSICLVVISIPDICSSISLSKGYPPRPPIPAGSRLTELQAETTGTSSREILFPKELRNMPYSIVQPGYSRNRRIRFAAVER